MVNWIKRYKEAHRNFQAKEYPAAFRDFGYLEPIIPDVRKSNGLTRMILYFLKWEGWRATRVNTQGRLIDKVEKQQSGTKLIVKGWIPTTTRKGTADISATIKGRSSMFEVKVEGDTPRVKQLKEAVKERKAGGIYEFIYTPDDFILVYDTIIDCITNDKKIIIPVHRGTLEEKRAIERFIKKGELTLIDLL